MPILTAAFARQTTPRSSHQLLAYPIETVVMTEEAILSHSPPEPQGTNPTTPTLPLSCGVTLVSWDRPFDQPVPLPGERPASTLRDAGNYIRKLPGSKRNTPEWRLAVQMLIDAAEDRGPVLFAKLGMERALNRKVENAINSDPKSRHTNGTGLPSAR